MAQQQNPLALGYQALLSLHAVHTFWSSGTRRTKTSATSLAKLLPVLSTTWRLSKVVWAPSLDAMTLSVLRDESSSSLLRPINMPLSSTPISYIASPSPSWRRHFICVTRCSRRDGEGFTSFSCYDLWKKMFNQNILLIKYSSVYEVYLVSAVTFNLKHTVFYLNRSSSKMPLITSHIYICRCVKIRGRGAPEKTTIKSLKS